MYLVIVVLAGACNCQSCMNEKTNEDLQHSLSVESDRHPFEVKSSIETTPSGIDIPVEVPGSHMEPDVLETLYLSQHSLSDNSRRLVQTSDNRTHSTQPVHLSDHAYARVDTSNQLDTGEDCKQSHAVCDTEAHVDNDQRGFTCEVCNIRFAKPSKFKTHMHIHGVEKPFSCKVCDRKFTMSSHLSSHMRAHTGEQPYSCEVCDRKFAQSSRLHCHVRIHTGERPFSCEVCEKKFSNSQVLQRHIRIHTGERPFSCEVCDNRFTDSSNLSRHMRTHTGERRFSCEVCGKKFAYSSVLLRHMSIHTLEQPFKCVVCVCRVW